MVKKLWLLVSIGVAYAAPPANWTRIANTSGTSFTNKPQTIFKTFFPGDYPAGSYPRPSIGGTPLTQWQVNPINHWRDATQSCNISGMTVATPPVVTPNGCNGIGPIYEGDRVTISGNGCVSNGIYTAANFQVSGAFTLIGASCAASSTTGTISAPDYGSIQTAFITFGVSVNGATFNGTSVTASTSGASATITVTGYSVSNADVNGSINLTGGVNFTKGTYTVVSVNVGLNQMTLNTTASTAAATGMTGQLDDYVQVDYVTSGNPCHLGNSATCNAAALNQAGILGFNGANWGAEMDLSANAGAATQSVNARTIVTAGSWRYYIQGPLLTQIIAEDRTSALAYDMGFRDLYTTIVTKQATTTATSITVSDASELVSLGLPQTMVCQATGRQANSPESITVNSAVGNVLSVTRGGSPLTLTIGSICRLTGLTNPGNPNSWQERPVAKTLTSSAGQCVSTMSATQTSMSMGAMDLLSTLTYPYTVQVDAEQMTASSNTGAVLSLSARGVNGTTAAVHPPCDWMYAQPFISDWVVAPTNAYKSLHPIFVLSFYTINGSQWPGVDEQFIMENVWWSKMQDQVYTLTIKTGASLATLKVNGDKVVQVAATRWRRRFWDGSAPGGLDCEYGTETGCGVAIDHNLAYFAYSKLIPNYDATRFPEIGPREVNLGASIPPNCNIAVSCGLIANHCATWPSFTVNSPVSTMCNFNPAIGIRASYTYDDAGFYEPNEPGPGGRGENSPITRWAVDELYAQDVTNWTNIQNNLICHEINHVYEEATDHIPWHNRIDVTGKFFDNLNQTDAFGRVPSRDTYPTSGSNLQGLGYNTSATVAASDIPTFVGVIGNFNMTTGTRTEDWWTPDGNHQGQLNIVGYLLTGDYYFLEEIQMVGSNDTRNAKAGTVATTSHNDWAIVQGFNTRGLAWVLRPIVVAAALSPDNSPEKRYFNQKYSYNMAVYEGSMNITNGYWHDPTNTSKWFWGRNTFAAPNSANGVGNPNVANPLGLFNQNLGGTASVSGFMPLDVGGAYPISICWMEAPWQHGFVISVLGMAEDLGLLQGKIVRQTAALYPIATTANFATYNSPFHPSLPGYLINLEYAPTRTGPSNGAANCTQSLAQNVDQAQITNWTTIEASVCHTTTDGCTSDKDTGAFNAWAAGVAGVGGNEQYAPIQYGISSYYVDVDLSPCPLRVSGTATCGLLADQWLKANVQNQQNFAETETWNWLPRPQAPLQCQITSPVPLPNGIQNVAYNQTLTAANCGALTWNISSGTLPNGLSLNAGSGVISGTPTINNVFPFTISATDGTNNPIQSNSITINPPCNFTVTSPFTSGQQGQVYSFTVATNSCVQPDSMILTSGSLPAGLSLGFSGGVWQITGTPTTPGLSTFTLQDTDAVSNVATLADIHLSIAAPAPNPGGTSAVGLYVGSVH